MRLPLASLVIACRGNFKIPIQYSSLLFSKYATKAATKPNITADQPEAQGDHISHKTVGHDIESHDNHMTKEASINDNITKEQKTDKNDVTLFLKKHQRVITLSSSSKQPHSYTLFIPRSDKVYNIHFKGQSVIDRWNKQARDKTLEDDAPSVESISQFMWREQIYKFKELPSHYAKLSKIRLTGLVVITAMGGYMIAPGSFDPLVFTLSTLGTGLLSAAANSINQFLEVPFDSQMNRTKNRVLVKGLLSPVHAIGFATASSLLGGAILYWGVNPLTCGLGVLNLGLYTMAYTPMKRTSILNTWVGSVVGAIPPMMGWAACTGALEPGAWLLGALLFFWQFPHFNALSWNLKGDYSRGGYRMTAVTHPAMCKRVALRHCIYLTLLCSVTPLFDVTSWIFAVNALPVNLYLTYLGWNFYRKGDSNSSRKLFRFSLIHLPVILLFMLITKKPQRHHVTDHVTTESDLIGHKLIHGSS